MSSSSLKVCLDLYSGTGGASEAFRLDDAWRVIRVDNDAQFSDVPDTIIQDASWAFNLLADEGIELLWASFPCTEFSRMDQPWTRKLLPPGFTPDMSEVVKVCDLINHLKPKYYCIENVRGAIPYLTPLLGKYSHHFGPYYLWTNLPTIAPSPDWIPGRKSQDMTGSLQRSAIPIELSKAVLEATIQPTLTLYCNFELGEFLED